jgi:peptidoglycan/xylan/chitin deacetylase (PgdA/CDA1 family)
VPETRRLVRLVRILVRVLLALVALAVFASPFAYTFYRNYQDQWFGPQLTTPVVRFPAAELTKFREAASSPGEQPLILAYHDVAWHSTSRYVVTPAEFAAQMAMLHAAGYHTLTARQIVRYVQGGSVPGRSVAITFDDGTRGLWTYASTILRRYHLHAISFIITGRVGTHRPYYLTWQEVRSMYASGNWDFESHTNDLHTQVPVAPGRLGDPLTQRIWLPREHRLESMMEFRMRVQQDLLQSISDIQADHLPRPVLFAYPFSDSVGTRPYAASEYSNKIVHKLFAVAMTNYIDPAVPVSRREASTGLLSRLEVTSKDTGASLFTRLRETSSLPTGDVGSFDDPARWQGSNGDPADIVLRDRDVRLRSKHGDWDYAAYAPGATADWDNYEISADIAGLGFWANPSATISVRVGSSSQLNVSVANHYLQVRWGSVQNRAITLARHLRASVSHRVTVRVFRDTTVVLIDGRVVMSGTCASRPSCASLAAPGHPATGGAASTGGFALSGFRPDRHRPFAHFDHVTVRPLAS